jgi:hypothetical protein
MNIALLARPDHGLAVRPISLLRELGAYVFGEVGR